MPGINVADVASIVTKKIYSNEEAVRQMINSAPYFKARKPNLLALGTDYTFGIKESHSQGMGVRGDDEALPTPGKPTYRTPSWDYPVQYLALQLTGQAIDRTKNNKLALANLVKDEVKDSTVAYAREQEFQCFGAAAADAGVTSGARGVTEGAIVSGADVTVTVEAGYKPLRGVFQGMDVEFYNETTEQLITTGTVKSVNKSAGTFVITNLPADVADGSYIYRKGNRNREINPLLNIVQDASGPSTFLGIDSSGEWLATVLDNSAVDRILTLELLDEAYYASMEQNDTDPDEIWLDYIQQRKFVALLNRNRTISNGGQVVTANLKGEIETYGKASVNISSMANPGKLYVLQSKHIKFSEWYAFHWITEENAKNMWHWVQGFDKFIATAKHSYQHFCDRRNVHARIDDLVKTAA